MKLFDYLIQKVKKKKVFLVGDVRYFDRIENDELKIIEIKKILTDSIYFIEKSNCNNCSFKDRWSKLPENSKKLYESISSLLETFDEIYRDPSLIRSNYQGPERDELITKITEISVAISRAYYTNLVVSSAILENAAGGSSISDLECKRMVRNYESMENDLRKQVEQLSLFFNKKVKDRLAELYETKPNEKKSHIKRKRRK